MARPSGPSSQSRGRGDDLIDTLHLVHRVGHPRSSRMTKLCKFTVTLNRSSYKYLISSTRVRVLGLEDLGEDLGDERSSSLSPLNELDRYGTMRVDVSFVLSWMCCVNNLPES